MTHFEVNLEFACQAFLGEDNPLSPQESFGRQAQADSVIFIEHLAFSCEIASFLAMTDTVPLQLQVTMPEKKYFPSLYFRIIFSLRFIS